MAVETAMRKDYFVKLNLRVGFIKFRQNSFYFENIKQSDNSQEASIWTCNTEFKQNKQLMTNLANERIS